MGRGGGQEWWDTKISPASALAIAPSTWLDPEVLEELLQRGVVPRVAHRIGASVVHSMRVGPKLNQEPAHLKIARGSCLKQRRLIALTLRVNVCNQPSRYFI